VDVRDDLVLTAGKTIRVWSATGRELLVMRPNANVEAAAFSPDGKWIAAAVGTAIQLWSEGKLALKLTGHHGAIATLAFSPDGKTLASAGGDRVIRLWSIPPRDEAAEAHTGSVHAVRWSKDGHLATASADRSVILWKDGKFVRRLTGHEDTVFDVAFSPDGSTIASCGADRTIRIWRDRELRRWTAHDGAVYALAYGDNLYSGGEDRAIRMWDPATGWDLGRAEDAGAVLTLALEGDRLVSAGAGRHVRLWSLKLQDEGNVPANDLCTYGVSMVSGTIVSCGGDQAVRVGTAVMAGHDQIVYSVSLSPDAKHVASGGWDGTVRVWEIDSEREVLILRGHSGPVYSVAFSPDGKRLASAGHDTTALVWDARPASAMKPEEAWEALAGDDPAKAYRALGALTPEFLKSKIPSGDPARLIAELDDADIETRERAFEELRELGDRAEKALREAKGSEPVDRLLALLAKPPKENPHRLRRLRAVQALERLGAKELLATLAERGSSPRERADARAALARLSRP
jgi:WD40 repeat protein